MQWLAQNWIWILLGVGLLFFMARRGGIGGCGTGHAGRHHHSQGDPKNLPPVANDDQTARIDPVSRRALQASGSPISTVYRGHAYYFETRSNREAFEAEPEKYLAGSPDTGQPIESLGAYRDRPRRRHGC